MERPDYDSPTSLKQLLLARGFTMQKKFGQNFLVNRTAREKIVSLVGAKAGDSVWEIGPGLGAMTSHLVDAGYDVSAFEIDYGFIEMLREIYAEGDAYRLIPGDILKTWKVEWEKSGTPKYVFGNLPYSIAGGIIANFIQYQLKPERMVFTVQKESADRMRAKVDSSNYSSFSVLCQSAFKIKSALDLKPGNFWPVPDVTSSVVVMEPRTDFPEFNDRLFFLKLLRALFATRRKTLRNNLKALEIPLEISLAALETLGIAFDRRAETLTPEDIAAFSNILSKAMGEKP